MILATAPLGGQNDTLQPNRLWLSNTFLEIYIFVYLVNHIQFIHVVVTLLLFIIIYYHYLIINIVFVFIDLYDINMY